MAEAQGTTQSKSGPWLAAVASSLVCVLGCSDPRVALGPLGRGELVVGGDGWVEESATRCGIQGSWYAYNDCGDSPGDCTSDQEPPIGEFANRQSWMCTCGTTTARSEDQGANKWGAGIGLDLNCAGEGAPKHALGELGEDGAHFVGFSFDLSGVAPGLRVNFPTASTVGMEHFETVTKLQSTDASSADPHCWYSELEVSTAKSQKPLVGRLEATAQRITVLFRDTAQGSWVSESERVPLDWTAIKAIQFQIPATTDAVRFDFCIGHLAALY